MEIQASEISGLERVLVGRILRVGALGALLAAGANAMVFTIATSLLGVVFILHGGAVTLGQVVGASVVGSIGAAVVFSLVYRFTRRPVRVFWGIAAVGLLLSFVPIALSGASGATAGTLAFMHAVAAGIDVGLLTRLGRKG